MFATRRSRLWRLIMSHLLWDQEAMAVTASEIRDREWKMVALDAISLVSNDLYMRCGSLDNAVQFAMRQVLSELEAVSIPGELGGQRILEEEMVRKPKDEELVEIRLRADVGTFHNLPDVRRGDVVTVDRANARRYVKNGLAQPADWDTLGAAYAPIHDSVVDAL